jgi:DnaJ like chaperone protein
MNPVILIGGLIGYLLGRLPGLVVGALIGYFLAPLLKIGAAVSKVTQAQSQFLESTFAVMGAVCKIDGKVNSYEIRVAEQMFERMRLSPAARETAKAAFNRGKSSDFDLDAEVARFAQASRGLQPLRQMFLQIQLAAMAADGVLHPSEHALLLRIARGLGVPEIEVRRLEAMFRGAHPGASATRQDLLADAYQVLGVNANASDAEVKQAYRRLMSQNHPDKLAAKGVPESMRELAEEKSREITVAYDRIRQARKLA